MIPLYVVEIARQHHEYGRRRGRRIVPRSLAVAALVLVVLAIIAGSPVR